MLSNDINYVRMCVACVDEFLASDISSSLISFNKYLERFCALVCLLLHLGSFTCFAHVNVSFQSDDGFWQCRTCIVQTQAMALD